MVLGRSKVGVVYKLIAIFNCLEGGLDGVFATGEEGAKLHGFDSGVTGACIDEQGPYITLTLSLLYL